jgi:UPF0755 protein
MPPIIETNETTSTPSPKRWGFPVVFVIIILVAASYLSFLYLKEAPVSFPVNQPFIIEQGTGIKAVASKAKEAGLVKSEILLYTYLITIFKDTPPQASTYIFEAPLNSFGVAASFAKGDHDSNLISITIPEGTSLKDIANIASKSLPKFDTEAFLRIAVGQEGFLFPETYFVPASYTEEDMYKLLNDTFSEKIRTLEPALSGHSLSLTEIVILASIIEREANSVESMKMVSGILQERLRIGMALQVDASMEYVLDKPLSELTAEDLKMESPYNTYLNPGLPPTPIGNPGFDSIKAVLEPTPSEYLFYITGSDGNFYYARTFDEHKKNIARYLR